MIEVNKVMTWKECEEKYPNMWIQMKKEGAVYGLGSEVVSAHVINVLTDEEYRIPELVIKRNVIRSRTGYPEGAVYSQLYMQEVFGNEC